MTKKFCLPQVWRTVIIACLLFTSGLASPAPSHAFVPNSLKTYVVWNQFDATVNTFQRIGLIMSDARYQGLFTAVIVFALIFGGIFTVGTGMLSGKHPLWGWFRWLGIILAGIVVYLTFIKPVTQITIYDEALNESQTVGGIPEGIVVIAGLANTIEQGFVDMIWTAAAPQSYRNDAGGLTLSIYQKAFSGGVDLSGGSPDGQYISMSLRRYIEDCVYFEMRRPGSTININDFSTTTDFRQIFQNAQSPAVYTIWYDNTARGGITLTCTEDWTNHLAPYLNGLVNANVDVTKYWQERCGEAGLGANSQVGGAVDLVSVCRQKAEDMTIPLFGAFFSSAHLFRQYLMAQALFDVYTEYAPDTAMAALANRSAGNAMIGMGIMANEWIPIIRSVVFSIFIGMIPLLCLLIPTPLFGRAISLLFGIFIFLTTWTICDALVHSFAVDKMLDLFKEISNGNLGFKSMMLFSTSSSKALAAFGAARWSAIMLAGVFSSILAKFGGSALAHFAGNLAAFKQYGGRAAESAANPSKWASEVQGVSQVVPSMVYANAGFKNISAVKAYETESKIGTSLGAVSALGAGSPTTAGAVTAGANITRLKEAVAHSGAISSYASAHGVTDNQVISAIQNYQTASQGGSARALTNLANDLHTSPYGAMDFMKEVGMKREYGQVRGLNNAYDNAVHENGYTGSFEDYVGMQSELQSERGFADVRAVDKFSANYRGGRAAFLKDQAEFRTGQAEGMLKKLRNKRLNPGSIGEVSGALQGIRNFVDSKVYAQFGDKGVEITRGGEQYNELSKMALKQAMNDIAETGHIRKDTQDALTKLKNIGGIAAAQLRSQEASTSLGVSPETAHQFGEYLRSQGANISDSELSGSTVNAGWSVDRNGKLVPSMIATKKGQKLAEMDLREKDFRRVQKGMKPGGGGWRGSFAGYDFISGERTDLGGGMVKINGVTKDGKIIDLLGSTTGGEGSIASEVVTQGPSYKGALVMAQGGKVPTKAFHNQADSAIFASEYAKEMNSIYEGKMSKDRVGRVIHRIGGRLGLNLGKIGNIGGGKETMDTLQISEKSATDIVTQAAMTINMSDISNRQKQSAYQELNAMLMDMKTERAKDLPEASTMMGQGKHPEGEIRSGN